MQKINFKTSDGVTIAANWFAAIKSKKGAILLHMRPATKESWNKFAIKLNEAGFSALAIDLRGHGESIIQNGKRIDYKNFPDGSHADCTKDVDAAIQWLKERGIDDIAVIGGSIGANLAIDAMARYAEIKKGVAISPGLEYLGVPTDNKISSLKKDQKIFLIASEDDRYSYESVLKLEKINSSAKTKLYEDAGHAMNIFAEHPELIDEIIQWLK